MKTKEEIEAMIDEAELAVLSPKFRNMTYEEGVQAALDWVLNRPGESPNPFALETK